MPASGGATDKFGNWYETLWTIDQLLRIVDGTASRLILEPLDKTESRGVEFAVSNLDGTTDYWSVKRQTSKAAGWTVALLAAKDETGRSILADLHAHVARSEMNHGVFASTLGSHEMEELRLHATSEASLKARLESSVSLKLAFAKVTSLCGGNAEHAREFLLRLRTHAADETQLRERVHTLIKNLFYKEGGFPVDAAAVRGYLEDLLRDKIHLPINRELILATLQEKGIRVREWALDSSVLQRISTICESYYAPLKADMINDVLLPVAPPQSILNENGIPAAQKILVVGAAGAGKSTVLADTVERLHLSKIPVLVIRFDQIPDGILTTTELGRKFLLPESPALVLAGVANGGPCVLVIDQLDAVSMASGRRTELWSLFSDLHREAERFPSTSLIVGLQTVRPGS